MGDAFLLSDFFDDLHNVLVVEHVIFAHSLRLMLHRRAPYQSANWMKRKKLMKKHE